MENRPPQGLQPENPQPPDALPDYALLPAWQQPGIPNPPIETQQQPVSQVSIEEQQRARQRRAQELDQQEYLAASASTSRKAYLDTTADRHARWIAGDNPSPELEEVAADIANGEYAKGGTYEPREPVEAIKKELKDDPSLRVELPTGRFIRVGRLKHKHMELLSVSRRPEARYRSGHSGDTGLVADITKRETPQSAARRQHIAAKQEIYRQEGRVWQREYGKIAELHSITHLYNHYMEHRRGRYRRAVDDAVQAFDRGLSPLDQRITEIDNLAEVVKRSGTDVHDTVTQYSNEVIEKVNEMHQIADAALTEQERKAVEQANGYMDDIFTLIQNKGKHWWSIRRGWRGVAIKIGINELLPSSSEPYTGERAVNVRIALNKHVMEIAQKLASGGDYKQAQEALAYFHSIHVLHKHTYQAMKIVTDHAYMVAVENKQKDRIHPGSSDISYLTTDGNPRRKVRRLSANAEAFSSKAAAAAIETAIDSIVISQI